MPTVPLTGKQKKEKKRIRHLYSQPKMAAAFVGGQRGRGGRQGADARGEKQGWDGIYRENSIHSLSAIRPLYQVG